MEHEAKKDAAYIRRAVELADLNAVKLAMFHITRDEAFAALPVGAKMSPEQKAWLADKAAAWLEKNAGPANLEEPAEADLRRMMDMVTGIPNGEMEFNLRRDLTGFKEFPYMVDWTNGKPEIPEGFKVAVIGSGFAGIGTGVQLDNLGIPYTVYERRKDPGGVWNINRYPDVRVDTISITYEFLFERDHEWSEYFGRGAEVREYLRKVSKKRGVFDKTRFEHDLKKATWDDDRNVWKLEFDTPDGVLKEDANAIISCAGLFATPKVVDWEGQENFKGEIVHTALWKDDVDLKGKKIATVGQGSTGIQMLGALAREGSQVTVFQRTAQWMMPREKYGEAMEPEVQWLVHNLPGYWNWWRYSATSGLFETHGLMQVDPEWQAKGGIVSEANDQIRRDLTAYMSHQLGGRQDLIDKVMPDYAPFSRRPIVDNGWYKALTQPNVELVTTPIKRLVPEGIETADGKIYEADLFVTATGFDVVKYLWPARYIGKDGVDLHQKWDEGDGPRAYVGMMNPGFPNLWTLYGPNSQPVSGGPAQPVWFAIWCSYATQCIIKMLETGHAQVDVKQDAFDRYNAELDEEASKLISMNEVGGVGKNYYVNTEHMRLQVNSPFYAPYYHKLCSTPVWDDLTVSGQLTPRGTRPD
ncbi:flavin-containing monooxygenase [Sphingomonas crocodyli]|uniref:flavin-containing monooxygenase n=1 Tax=Sphingomonas crocodyli TaxID=1979270 RepID=UPI0013E3F836|nr:NAD(P)/FAD-dependent oxidoreductase [Sphingomonas crocodyli]